MKNLKSVSTILFILGILVSCSKDNDPKPKESDWFIFGTYYGLCATNCTTLYKVEEGQLFLDDVDRVIPDEIPFLTDALSDEKYQIAKAVMDIFPGQLFDESEAIIGCPDCADQGGYYIEWKEDNQRMIWRLDTDQDALPDNLSAFVQKMEEAILDLE